MRPGSSTSGCSSRLPNPRSPDSTLFCGRALETGLKSGHNTVVQMKHHHHDHGIAQDSLREIFAKRGLRTTRQRESVYRALCQCNEHPTAEQLLSRVHAIDPEVSQATVYNTLDTLVECGLATRIPASSSGGACRYDPDTDEHVHLVLADGRILDVPDDLSKRLIDAVPAELLQELSERLGVTCSGIKIELSGS